MIYLNAERFISEAIQSVLGQRYATWELLLVDDGSTDRSLELALEFERRYPSKIRIFSHANHENRGMSASRNLGLREARGEYVAFLDADDVWLPNKLEDQVKLLENTPQAGFTYGTTQYWFSWSATEMTVSHDHLDFDTPQGFSFGVVIPPPTLLGLLLTTVPANPCICSILVRRHAAQRAGGFEDSFRDLYEDQVFYAKLYVNEGVVVTPNCVARYRQHPDSACAKAKANGEDPAAKTSFLRWLSDLVSRTGITDPRIVRPLQRSIWSQSHPRLAVLNPFRMLRKLRSLFTQGTS
jgi:glycosyltransferase involved in cell wall biosynthesis